MRTTCQPRIQFTDGVKSKIKRKWSSGPSAHSEEAGLRSRPRDLMGWLVRASMNPITADLEVFKAPQFSRLGPCGSYRSVPEHRDFCTLLRNAGFVSTREAFAKSSVL